MHIYTRDILNKNWNHNVHIMDSGFGHWSFLLTCIQYIVNIFPYCYKYMDFFFSCCYKLSFSDHSCA